jgi:hypothetical protein
MTRWTNDNTKGFTAAELAMLNEAQDRLDVASPGVDPGNIADRLYNAFYPGITVDDLVAAASL